MNLIVAVDQAFGIGAKNGLLYNLKADMEYFKKTTMGKVVVMGSATLDSFPGGRALKNRTNICLNPDPNAKRENVIYVKSLDELFQKLKDYNTEDVFVIGGAYVYSQLLPYCKTAYITKIEATRPAEKFFPNIDQMPNWQLTSQGEKKEEDGITFSFCVYTNNNPQKF